MERQRWIGTLVLGLLVPGAGTVLAEGMYAQGAGPRVGADYGIGIVAFAMSPAPGVESLAADSLVIRQQPSDHAPVVARFVLEAPEPFIWSYALEATEPGIESNAVEFDYEVQGLPFDSVGAGGAWIRVIYGRAAGGTARRGWVRGDAGQMQVRRWAEELPEHPLFFLGPEENVAFYDRPGGERVPFELARGGPGGGPPFDYRLEPIELDGRWMKVRVVTPDGSCAFDPVQERERIAWIEYLDEGGRPRVWYHTRGC